MLLPVALFAVALALLFLSAVLGEGSIVLGLAVVLAPLAGALALAVLLCLPGTRGPNRFGSDPKDPTSTTDLAEVFR